jgi:hypothetical protein
MATTLPPQYRAAKLRCVLPYHAENDRMGVGFELEDGTVLRLALDGASMRALIEWGGDYLVSGCQSPRSSEIPSVAGSVDPGQSQCPPARFPLGNHPLCDTAQFPQLLLVHGIGSAKLSKPDSDTHVLSVQQS